MENKQGNILGTQPIGQLLLKFAVPSIIAMQVSALYNIVDQIFIGHSVGVLGNAATNVAFPLSTVCAPYPLLPPLQSKADPHQNKGECHVLRPQAPTYHAHGQA